MSLLIALILGMVQGLSEFLPISSSGHLVLLQNLFGIRSDIIIFDVILHLGTLVAVIICYRKSIINLLKNPLSKKMKLLVVGTIPTVLIALLFKDFFENAFSGNLLFVGFLMTAVLLFVSAYCEKKNVNKHEMSYSKIFVMGIFQGLAIFPGLSRSGSTTSAGLVCGVKKEEALEYSFLLSIPIILASLVYELIFSPIKLNSIGFAPILAGFLASLVFGILSISFMKKVVKNNSYIYFSVYLLIISTMLILNQFCFNWF